MLCYDQAVFNSFREKAITKLEDLEVGKTYYSNTWPEKFTVQKVVSYKELCEIEDKPFSDDYGLTDSTWIQDTEGRFHSTHDRNIDAHYNPWLIFENEQDMRECCDQLKITHEDDDWDRGWDDMDLYDDGYSYGEE